MAPLQEVLFGDCDFDLDFDLFDLIAKTLFSDVGGGLQGTCHVQVQLLGEMVGFSTFFPPWLPGIPYAQNSTSCPVCIGKIPSRCLPLPEVMFIEDRDIPMETHPELFIKD